MNSLIQARLKVVFNLNEGIECPCCEQYCRAWKYKVHSTVARILIELYNKTNESDIYFHINDLWASIIEGSKKKQLIGGDFAKLVLWDLIEKMPKKEKGKKSTGYYKITPKGSYFVTGHIGIKSYLLVYNNQILEESEESITIKESLSDKFDYDKLIRG